MLHMLGTHDNLCMSFAALNLQIHPAVWRKSDKEVVISSLLLPSLESPYLSENTVKKDYA